MLPPLNFFSLGCGSLTMLSFVLFDAISKLHPMDEAHVQWLSYIKVGCICFEALLIS